MKYWSAIEIVKQVAGELGLGAPTSLVGTDDIAVIQLRALLNAAGSELLLYYPWEQFIKTFTVTTEEGVDSYALPDDWRYFVSQTQWDQTNHWPLLGPKSPQEWSWLKSGMGHGTPTLRYRVYRDKLNLHPVPGSSPYTLNMEYIKGTWAISEGVENSLVIRDGDFVQYDPWLINRYMKLKFYDLKGFDSAAVAGDFMRIFNALVGKDVGAPVLSLVPQPSEGFIGPWSIPDGSWNVS